MPRGVSDKRIILGNMYRVSHGALLSPSHPLYVRTEFLGGILLCEIDCLVLHRLMKPRRPKALSCSPGHQHTQQQPWSGRAALLSGYGA
jgi:hypothetical protein